MAYEPIQPTQIRYDEYPVEAFALKIPYFHSGRNNFKSEVNTWVSIGPAYQGIFVATWEYWNIEKSFGIRILFPKISAENVHSWYPYKQFWPKNPDSAMKPCSNSVIFIVYQYA